MVMLNWQLLLIPRMIYFHLVGTDSHNLPTPLVYYLLHVSKIAVHKFVLTCSQYSRTASYKYVLDVARIHRALNNHYLHNHDAVNTFSLYYAMLSYDLLVMLQGFHIHNVDIHQQIHHTVKTEVLNLSERSNIYLHLLQRITSSMAM
ncbi:Uncharacterised protein [Streptococcus pneumoniae]|nr:Uncharacterised protein [Streptococcus pneumoniae]